MCGRFTIYHPVDAVAKRFFAEPMPGDFAPRYNVAPTESAIIVTNITPRNGEGVPHRRSLELCRWGLIPSWADNMSIGARMINARGEELAEKPAFRKALASRRCIVPVSGFYEWKAAKGKAAKQPMYVHPAHDELFGLAGLWETWRNPEGGLLKSFTIITVPANDALREFHDRMPAILSRDAEDLWLDPDVDAADVRAVLLPAPVSDMAMYPVTTRVNTAGVDDRCFIERIEESPSPTETLTLDL